MPLNKGTRTGYTTGACATACARAALLMLSGAEGLRSVEITLPQGQKATFDLARSERQDGVALAAVIKDGGDDPDVTHGAEISARVCLTDEPGQVSLLGGPGVGQVTRPGLGLQVGGPAINPVPRRMITEHCLATLAELGLQARGVEVTVMVADGEQIAKKTLNGRLGIVGGISILGRTGIVYPYSHAAYIASITQAVDVARAQGADTVVLTTGGQTEGYAQALFPQLSEVCFVQMGDFVGKALEHCAKAGITRVVMVAQVGKAAKLAQGMLHTHAGKGPVDLSFLARLAQEAGARAEEAAILAAANTARHAYELSLGQPWAGAFFQSIAEHSARVARDHAAGAYTVESWLLDFEGKVLARAELPSA